MQEALCTLARSFHSVALSPPVWPLRALVVWGGRLRSQGGLKALRKGCLYPTKDVGEYSCCLGVI